MPLKTSGAGPLFLLKRQGLGKSENMKLIVGKGMDRLLFGCTEDFVVSELGRPDKVYFADDGDRRLAYDCMRCCFWFRNDRLHWIICAHPDLRIFGRSLHGLTTTKVIGFLREHLDDTIDFDDYDEMESHTFEENWVELQGCGSSATTLISLLNIDLGLFRARKLGPSLLPMQCKTQ